MRLPTYRGFRTNKKVSLVMYSHICGTHMTNVGPSYCFDNWALHWNKLSHEQDAVYNNVKKEPYRYYSPPTKMHGMAFSWIYKNNKSWQRCSLCNKRGCRPFSDLVQPPFKYSKTKSLKKQKGQHKIKANYIKFVSC